MNYDTEMIIHQLIVDEVSPAGYTLVDLLKLLI